MWRPCGVIDDTYEKDLAIIRTGTQWAWLAIGLILLYLIPHVVSPVALNTINYIAITIVALHGVNILTGMTGLITLGHASFMAVGAFCMTLLVVHWGWSFWLAAPMAALLTGLMGIIVGLPSLRIKGFYLAMATLAAQFIIPWLIVNVRPDLTGGTDTLNVPPPAIGGFLFSSQTSLFYLCITVAVLATCFSRNLLRSRFGRAFIAIRDNDLAAEIMGIAIVRYKLMSFFLCSVYAGLAGALYAVWMRGISVEHFDLNESVWYLGMLIVGGMGSVPGVVFGAILIRSMNIIVMYLGPFVGGFFPAAHAAAIEIGFGPVVFGLVVMGFLIFEPRGLARIWERFKAFYRLWPFSY
ncbi:MAG: branched-chain amino acid ABC transporter permease [Deltaproteobacteria bacterium]|nr:branched-chain amino acid ABC transporter permease [Deltaproteobacteria bacterium]MBW1816387.1 branched-chain amino acid ABC transporter permease [Deltaproteobacteria bacterium]MBW2284033.1 branched-chain amino acid ABC transporter permease [Deltaproteobacteria bacterium]